MIFLTYTSLILSAASSPYCKTVWGFGVRGLCTGFQLTIDVKFITKFLNFEFRDNLTQNIYD